MFMYTKYSHIEIESQAQHKFKYLIIELHDHGRSPHYKDCVNQGHSSILTEKLSRKIYDKFVNSVVDAIAHQILSHWNWILTTTQNQTSHYLQNFTTMVVVLFNWKFEQKNSRQFCKFGNWCHWTLNTFTLKYNSNHNPKLNIPLHAELHDHGHSPHYKNDDHDHSLILTEKLSRKNHDKFVNLAIDAIAHRILPHWNKIPTIIQNQISHYLQNFMTIVAVLTMRTAKLIQACKSSN